MSHNNDTFYDVLVLSRLTNFYYGHISQKKLGLSTPLFRISTTIQELASWDPSSRVISISRDLLNNFSSTAVKFVLLHEMAHQVVTDVFRLHSDHGPVFQRACDLVGVPKALRVANINIDVLNGYENLNGDISPEEDVVLRRVEKLLALSQSSNEHEALLAMKKVQELMKEDYKNRISGVFGPGKAVVVTIDLKSSRVQRSILLILSILIKFYFVKSIMVKGFDPKTGRDTTYIEFIGQKIQVNMAIYVFHYLKTKVEFLWKVYKNETGSETRLKRSYQLGLLTGFYNKLNQLSPQEDNALIVSKDPLVESFFAERHPHTRSVTTRNGGIYSDVYEQGIEEGKNIVINKPLHESNKSDQKFYLKSGS